MKHFFPFLLLLLVACQREVDDTLQPPQNNGAASGSFTAKIDGVPWAATKVAYAHFSEAANGAPALFSIYGLGNDKKLVGITIADSGVHVYTFTDNSFGAGVFQDSSLPDVYSFSTLEALRQPSGVLNLRSIDKANKTVSGTFNFIVHRSFDGQGRTITDGVFTNVPYTVDSDLPAASATDTLRAKIDGAVFTPYRISATNMTITNSIMVQGNSQTGGKVVGLSFPNDIAPGTYTLDLFGGTHVGIYSSGTASLAAISGTVTILEHNRTTKRVRGTFSFDAENLMAPSEKATISDGYFSVTYP